MNKIIQLLRDGMMGKLIVGQGTTPVIPAGETMSYNLGIQVDKLLLKSIEVTCNKNTKFSVQFYENPERINSRYHSGHVMQEAYDVLDLPYQDAREEQTMYFSITNLGDFDASYDIEVRGIELK